MLLPLFCNVRIWPKMHVEELTVEDVEIALGKGNCILRQVMHKRRTDHTFIGIYNTPLWIHEQHGTRSQTAAQEKAPQHQQMEEEMSGFSENMEIFADEMELIDNCCSEDQ